MKQKLKNAPKLVVAGQVRSGPRPHPGVRQEGPRARGASAGMVPWVSGMKLCRETRTHPARSMHMLWMDTSTPWAGEA